MCMKDSSFKLVFGNSRQQYIIVFSFVAIFVSQERFLLWKMTPEHLTDCERNMSHNMSQVGNTWKYYQWSFIVLHIFQIPVYIIYIIGTAPHSLKVPGRYSSLSSGRFLFSNVKHEIKCVE